MTVSPHEHWGLSLSPKEEPALRHDPTPGDAQRQSGANAASLSGIEATRRDVSRHGLRFGSGGLGVKRVSTGLRRGGASAQLARFLLALYPGWRTPSVAMDDDLIDDRLFSPPGPSIGMCDCGHFGHLTTAGVCLLCASKAITDEAGDE